MAVYLLHFSSRINPSHPCQHYLGWADSLERRLQHHRQGTGARLTKVARQRGISFELVRVWDGDRALERKLKRWKNGRKLCPVCTPR